MPGRDRRWREGFYRVPKLHGGYRARGQPGELPPVHARHSQCQRRRLCRMPHRGNCFGRRGGDLQPVRSGHDRQRDQHQLHPVPRRDGQQWQRRVHPVRRRYILAEPGGHAVSAVHPRHRNQGSHRLPLRRCVWPGRGHVWLLGCEGRAFELELDRRRGIEGRALEVRDAANFDFEVGSAQRI